MQSFMLNEIMVQPEAVWKTLEGNRKAIVGITSHLKANPVNSAFLVARGTSDHTGIYAKYLAEYMLEIPVCLAASSIINIYQKPLNLKSALTIAISQSGEGPDVIGVIKEARRQEGLSLAITNNENSTLPREADYSLFCFAREENRRRKNLWR